MMPIPQAGESEVSLTKGIHETYLHFLDWAKSGGALYPGWYKNTGSGYRSTQNIYSK